MSDFLYSGLLEASVLGATSMNQATWLKENHNFGHGLANALVAVFRKERAL